MAQNLKEQPKAELDLPAVLLEEIFFIRTGLTIFPLRNDNDQTFDLDGLLTDEKRGFNVKAFVSAADLARWNARACKWLEWGTRRAPAAFYRPRVPEWFESSQKLLSAVDVGFEKRLRVAYDDKKLYHTDSVLSFVSWHYLSGFNAKLMATSRRFDVKYVLAIMNSATAHAQLTANRRGKRLFLLPTDWNKLPVPPATSEKQRPLIKIVESILAIKDNDPDADVTCLEATIDGIAARLYGQTEQEFESVLLDLSLPEPALAAARSAYQDVAWRQNG